MLCKACIACLAAAALALPGCLTVTNERPPYADLDQHEKDAVNVVLTELRALDQQVKSRTKYTIDRVVDREAINVSFEGMIFTYNLGDGTVHVAAWENLTDAQQALVQSWFKSSSLMQARVAYEKLFYRLMGVAQGVKQFMFESLTPGWVFAHRTLFNIERDSIRVALSHFVAEGRQGDMWTFAETTCKPVLDQYGSRWAYLFKPNNIKTAKKYLQENFGDLANPDDPTGYMYFICQWIEMGRRDALDLTSELQWLVDLPK